MSFLSLLVLFSSTNALICHSTFQIFFYALRPMFVHVQTLTRWHLFNVVTQLTFDYVLVKMSGIRPLIYLIMSSFFTGSLHPCAGHFIAEHYLWDGLSQETYSYYGPLNILAYNVRRDFSHCGESVLTSMHCRLVIIMNTTTFHLSLGRVFRNCGH